MQVASAVCIRALSGFMLLAISAIDCLSAQGNPNSSTCSPTHRVLVVSTGSQDEWSRELLRGLRRQSGIVYAGRLAIDTRSFQPLLRGSDTKAINSANRAVAAFVIDVEIPESSGAQTQSDIRSARDKIQAATTVPISANEDRQICGTSITLISSGTSALRTIAALNADSTALPLIVDQFIELAVPHRGVIFDVDLAERANAIGCSRPGAKEHDQPAILGRFLTTEGSIHGLNDLQRLLANIRETANAGFTTGRLTSITLRVVPPVLSTDSLVGKLRLVCDPLLRRLDERWYVGAAEPGREYSGMLIPEGSQSPDTTLVTATATRIVERRITVSDAYDTRQVVDSLLMRLAEVKAFSKPDTMWRLSVGRLHETEKGPSTSIPVSGVVDSAWLQPIVCSSLAETCFPKLAIKIREGQVTEIPFPSSTVFLAKTTSSLRILPIHKRRAGKIDPLGFDLVEWKVTQPSRLPVFEYFVLQSGSEFRRVEILGTTSASLCIEPSEVVDVVTGRALRVRACNAIANPLEFASTDEGKQWRVSWSGRAATAQLLGGSLKLIAPDATSNRVLVERDVDKEDMRLDGPVQVRLELECDRSCSEFGVSVQVQRVVRTDLITENPVELTCRRNGVALVRTYLCEGLLPSAPSSFFRRIGVWAEGRDLSLSLTRLYLMGTSQ